MIEYEWKHLKPENRESGQFIEVLHPDFKEFGMSGKVYDRSDFECIELHVAEYEISDFQVDHLAEDCRLCTYTLIDHTRHIKTNSTSIWKMHEGDWKLLFHQGTVKQDPY
ncbi:hypothetical protein O4M67_002497 [Staphylococcus pseudintermedius]|nr:hypothetical protein [Staphylococcus pseudintermedius]EKH2225864.1 hypothetical protein [Staphylococcus pseudintermedius]